LNYEFSIFVYEDSKNKAPPLSLELYSNREFFIFKKDYITYIAPPEGHLF
jgi:hypothetical protein